MIDYRANVAALDVFLQALTGETFNDPKISKIRDEQVADVDTAPGMALLGSLIDHLIWHAASDGNELALVERAAVLWKTGLSLYHTMTEFRGDLEGALADPTNPASVAKFNAGVQKFRQFRLGVEGKQAEVAVLRDDIYEAAYPHAHPRQEDKPLKEWTWADIFLARRTDAFARSIYNKASDGPSHAFALGVIASYGANTCGSAYLGQVVGGPRRSHRHRDRLARNAVGSWFARWVPGLASLTSISNQLKYGAIVPTLPTVIENVITGSLTDTYDLARTPPLPDLQQGYKRLLRHLEAVDSFVIPPPPVLPMEPFLNKIYGDTTNPPPSLLELGIESEDADGSGSGSGSGSGVKPKNVVGSKAVGEGDSRRGSKLDCGAFFMAFFRLVAILATLTAICWEEWGEGKECKFWKDMEKDFAEWWRTLWAGEEPMTEGGPQGDPTASAAALTAAAGHEEITMLIKNLYEAQSQLWQAMNTAYEYLSVCGLIYPDAILERELYKQFWSVPKPTSGVWPHLPETNSAERAHKYPLTAIEQPAAAMDPYPIGATPSAFLNDNLGGGKSAARISRAVWIQTASGQLDANNYDLDADRGLFHPCWEAGGSINDNPINVKTLDYSKT